MYPTIEHVRAHMSNLQPSAGSGDIARHIIEIRAHNRRERRERLSRYAAAIWRSLRFASRTAKTDSVVSVEATEMT